MKQTAQIIPFNARLEKGWADYLDARVTADTTGSLVDGIEAGRAWRRWLDLFMSQEQRSALDGSSVIGLRR